jgi:hypothetical protein
MTTAIKRRRGTTAEHSTFIGLEGEITIDSTKDTVVVHDGSTTGGFPLAKETGSSISAVDLTVTNGASVQGLTVGRGAGAVASNTAFGLDPLFANTTGGFNLAVGRYAFTSNTTGANNTALGRSLAY